METLTRPKTGTYREPKLWTKEECHRLADRGELDERYELIEGTIYGPMKKRAPHIHTERIAFHWLFDLCGIEFVQKEDPIAIPSEAGEINDPLPDLDVLNQPALSFTGGPPGPKDILLLVEVADSSLGFDRNIKANVHARAGIAEYWVMDVNGRQILRHRKPGKNGYGDIVVFGENETIAAPGRSETARVGELFAAIPADAD